MEQAPDGVVAVRSPLPGRVVGFDVQASDRVRAGQQLAVIEAMKMESAMRASGAGVVQQMKARVGRA
jgi:biotin carboxyl carrier protein